VPAKTSTLFILALKLFFTSPKRNTISLSVLIVQAPRKLAFGTIVKYCGSLIHRPQLHRVEFHLRVPAFQAPFIDRRLCSIFASLTVQQLLCIALRPTRHYTHFRTRNYLLDTLVLNIALTATQAAVHVPGRRYRHCVTTGGTKRKLKRRHEGSFRVVGRKGKDRRDGTPD